MDLSKIKCIILDFDGTLYSGGNFCDWEAFYNNFFKRENLLVEVDNPRQFLLKKYPKYHDVQAAFAYFRDNNISDGKFREFQKNEIYDFRSDDVRFINPEIIEEISKKIPLYMISDSFKEWIDFYFNIAKIKSDNFVEILSNQYIGDDFSKLPLMKRVLEQTKLRPDEILMIGDSKQFDIIPAKKIGFKTVWVKDVDDTAKILRKVSN